MNRWMEERGAGGRQGHGGQALPSGPVNPLNRWRWQLGPVRNRPQTLIDIGVAQGTPEFYRVNTDADLFLIDPIEEFKPFFERILSRRRGGYEFCAVGSTPGELEVTYDPSRPRVTSALTRATGAPGPSGNKRTVPVKTLDTIVDAHDLTAPFGIKIDTEGFELEVIKGAERTLANTAFVIAETSISQRFENGYTFWDFLETMHNHGFVVDNILSAEPGSRGRVRFMDVVYVPRSSR